ncbi:hypothetical protein AAFF_G00219130 [Aldrovandia affinis]|uniref:Uncharacterized protein n=1 Tax=Aldrovandia affinis TaxID=143900 RepID=A0AAD7SW23_9TELE|nr:hypothetical protein AAFF_G00219130 [Aldrovandia affinis]
MQPYGNIHLTPRGKLTASTATTTPQGPAAKSGSVLAHERGRDLEAHPRGANRSGLTNPARPPPALARLQRLVENKLNFNFCLMPGTDATSLALGNSQVNLRSPRLPLNL